MATGIIILIITFFVLIAIGVPIAYSIGISGILTMLVSIATVPAFATYAQRMASGLDSFSLLAIPFFILAGNIMNKGGIALRLVELAKVMVGKTTGGLAFVNVFSNMLFGAISGSAAASASAIGSIMGPEMKKEGYDENFSAAVNITSSTTGLSIPPSNVLIVYSLASGGVSISALFIAGYIPGILTGLVIMLMAMSMLIYKQKGIGAAIGNLVKILGGILLIIGIFYSIQTYAPAVSRKWLNIGVLAIIFLGMTYANRSRAKDALHKFWRAVPSLMMLVLVIGGIVAGYFTATEASAIAVLYALILALIYKEMAIKDLPDVLLQSVKTTAIVLFLVSTSIGLSWIMAYENIPQTVSSALLNISDNPIVILIIINVILLVVGTFMDMTPAILIFTPIFLPIVTQQLGINPIHFGIMLIMNLSIGLCTPPVGSVLFIGCSVANVKIEKVIRPLIPIFVAMIIVLLLVTYVPELSLWLPKLVGAI
ncbi:MAG TPA: TRAP transporter large permease [Saprospiraceae bacterium]|nr:TRAP transporter large permease [Saprospiraceae bacterium]